MRGYLDSSGVREACPFLGHFEARRRYSRSLAYLASFVQQILSRCPCNKTDIVSLRCQPHVSAESVINPKGRLPIFSVLECAIPPRISVQPIDPILVRKTLPSGGQDGSVRDRCYAYVRLTRSILGSRTARRATPSTSEEQCRKTVWNGPATWAWSKTR